MFSHVISDVYEIPTRYGSTTRSISTTEDGLIKIRHDIAVLNKHSAVRITGNFWMFYLMDVAKGEAFFLHDNHKTSIPARTLAMFVPPKSNVETLLSKTNVRSIGFISDSKVPKGSPIFPAIFECNFKDSDEPRSRTDIDEFFANSRNVIDVTRQTSPSALSRRAREALFDSYKTSKTISDLSESLNTSNSQLTRYFKKEFGMPPAKFRSWLRIMDAVIGIAKGRKIADTAFDVGFGDIGRFYKQFKLLARNSPASYKSTKTPR